KGRRWRTGARRWPDRRSLLRRRRRAPLRSRQAGARGPVSRLHHAPTDATMSTLCAWWPANAAHAVVLSRPHTYGYAASLRPRPAWVENHQTRTHSWSRPLLNRVAEEERDDHDRCGAGSECGEREEEPDKRLALAHPFALSTRRTVNGFCPGGSTWNDRPQWPTMTRAGAAWPYVPGA